MDLSTVTSGFIDGIPGWRRFPPNLFAIPFGLTGLAEAWHAAEQTLHTPEAVPDALAIVAALAWLTLRRPPGAAGCAAVILTAITIFIGYIAVRTLVLISRDQLLPPRVPQEKINTVIIRNERGTSPTRTPLPEGSQP
jgi:hypothetical protein